MRIYDVQIGLLSVDVATHLNLIAIHFKANLTSKIKQATILGSRVSRNRTVSKFVIRYSDPRGKVILHSLTKPE